MTENHFYKMGKKAKFLKPYKRYHNVYYEDPETHKNIFVKKVKHYKFWGRIPVIDEQEKNVCDSTYVLFSIHPEETKINMNVMMYGDQPISQNYFKKICTNKNFSFTTKQIEEYKLNYEKQLKQKQIDRKLKKLEDDFNDEEID